MSAAAEDKIAGLRTPTLAVSSLDDPIMTSDGSAAAARKNIEGLFVLVTKCVLFLPYCSAAGVWYDTAAAGK